MLQKEKGETEEITVGKSCQLQVIYVFGSNNNRQRSHICVTALDDKGLKAVLSDTEFEKSVGRVLTILKNA